MSNSKKHFASRNRRQISTLSWGVILVVALLALGASGLVLGATIEFLSGKKVECKVLSKDAMAVVVEVQVDGKAVKRTYQLNLIHKVTINDKQYLINEKPAASERATKKGPDMAEPPDTGEKPVKGPAPGAKIKMTKAAIEALIQEKGRSPPEWYEATPLNFPQTLDLSWPQPPPKGWNNQANVGQFLWDIINPNPGKWKEGIRFMHHLLALHKDNPELRARAMNDIGRMYFELHEDYPRAAFWWKQLGVDKNETFPKSRIQLAECYHRLGNDQLALELLRGTTRGNDTMIKLYAELGDLPTALQISEQWVANGMPDHGYLCAGDACRTVGKLPQAIAYYQKVLAVPAQGNQKGQIERHQRRARSNLEGIQLFELSDVRKVKDGTYQGEAVGYEGPVQVEVVVGSGKIESMRVTQHKEKQFYSALSDTPAKIIAKQGVKGVDTTSGATLTSEAIINGTAKAMAKGIK